MRVEEVPATGPRTSYSQMVQTVRNDHGRTGTRASEQKLFLTRAEVAATFGVSSSSVGRWARAGRLPYVLTLGGRRRFPRDKILELAAELAREAIPLAPAWPPPRRATSGGDSAGDP